MTDDNCARTTVSSRDTEYSDESSADVVGEVFVQLIGIDPTDVVSLDDRVKIAHRPRLSAQGCQCRAAAVRRATRVPRDRRVHPVAAR